MKRYLETFASLWTAPLSLHFPQEVWHGSPLWCVVHHAEETCVAQICNACTHQHHNPSRIVSSVALQTKKSHVVIMCFVDANLCMSNTSRTPTKWAQITSWVIWVEFFENVIFLFNTLMTWYEAFLRAKVSVLCGACSALKLCFQPILTSCALDLPCSASSGRMGYATSVMHAVHKHVDEARQLTQNECWRIETFFVFFSSYAFIVWLMATELSFPIHILSWVLWLLHIMHNMSKLHVSIDAVMCYSVWC